MDITAGGEWVFIEQNDCFCRTPCVLPARRSPNECCMEKKLLAAVAWCNKRGRWLILTLLLQVGIVAQLAAQVITVTGTVKDPRGAPLQGVSVNVKDTKFTALTDASGNYSIKVPGPDVTLVFSYVGFANKEEKLLSRQVINVTLAESTSDLNDVIVVGYGGTAKKKDLTGSISVLGSKQIAERQPVTLFDALQGQMAGVMITNDNGDPAGQGTIQIRGASTINSGNGPLYVIDGVMSEDANYINPADIETVEVFKDASSAAIYGARGANGVILITTKRGKEGRPTINFTYSHTLGKLAHKLRTTSAAELRTYRKLRGDGYNQNNSDTVSPYMNQDNDFQDVMFRTSHKQVATLSMSGGQKGLNYYIGATYTDDRAIVINSWLKRVQVRSNVDYQASSRLRISNNISVAYQTGNDIPVGNALKVVFDRNPWTALYRPDGSLTNYTESKRNPVAQALYTVDVDNNFTALMNTRLEYLVYKDLRFTTSFNAQLDSWKNNYFVPSSLTSTGTGDATGSNTFNQKIYWEVQSFFNYSKALGHDQQLNALLGVSADRRRSDGYVINMSNYLDESIYTSNAAQTININKTGTTATANADASLFGRVNYSYKGRYIVEGSFRRDGSSRFGANNKWGNFFAGSAAWRFSDEQFMNWTRSILNDGKLRFSVGQTGNDRINNYAAYTLINFGGEYYDGSSVAAPNTTFGNANIKWETTTQTDLGLDLSFFNNRMTFTADYYNKTTSNLLYNSQLGQESGATNVYVNVGTISNKGLELMLSGTPVSKRNFSWTVSGNVTFQNSRIEKLNNGTSFISGDKWLIQEGGRIGDFFVYKNLGVYAWDQSNAYDEAGHQLTLVMGADGKPTGAYTLNGKPYGGVVKQKSANGHTLVGGDTNWLDLNNDGVIDDKDRVIAGNGIPKAFFGFVNTIRYKNFSLNFLFNGNLGYQVYNGVKNAQNAFTSTYSPPSWDAIAYSWKKPGDVAIFPNITGKTASGETVKADDHYGIRNGMNSLYIEDGSFIRLSSAKLTYVFDQKILRKLKLKGLAVYLFGNNIATWTKYSWYDPEFSAPTDTPLNVGNDNGKYPKRREFGFGINANF